jgi:hypothetical protein
MRSTSPQFAHWFECQFRLTTYADQGVASASLEAPSSPSSAYFVPSDNFPTKIIALTGVAIEHDGRLATSGRTDWTRSERSLLDLGLVTRRNCKDILNNEAVHHYILQSMIQYYGLPHVHSGWNGFEKTLHFTIHRQADWNSSSVDET